jgi:hypothetical protein
LYAGAPLAPLDLYDSPTDFTGPTSIGPGGAGIAASSGSGHAFGLRFAPPVRLGNRTGGEGPHNGSSTWSGHSLGSLGVTPGNYHWSWELAPGVRDGITLLVRSAACIDGDGDGYGAAGHPDCPGGTLVDCNDADPLVHPSAADVCDGVDNNCQDGIDEGDVCLAALVDGTLVTLEIEVVQGAPLPIAPIVFPVVLGAPVGSTTIGNLQLDIDVENDSIDIDVTNLGGGLGNVAVVARLTGLEWTDPFMKIVGASVSGDYDYIAAEAPPSFPLPGAARIVDGGHGVEIYWQEGLLQSGEVHTSPVRFAAQPVVPAVPLMPAPALAVLALGLGGAGLAVLRRRPGVRRSGGGDARDRGE